MCTSNNNNKLYMSKKGKKNWVVDALAQGVLVTFSAGWQLVFTCSQAKLFELILFKRKSLHYIDKPGRQNRPRSRSIGAVPGP